VSAAGRLWSVRGLRLGGLLLLALALATGLGPAVLGLDPLRIDPAAVYAAPSAAHWLGTDELGRDVLARLLAGGRVSLGIGLLAALGSVALGALLGLWAGLAGGVVDVLVSRLVEAVSSVPRLPLMLLFLAGDLEPGGSGAGAVVLVVVALGWTGPARLARAEARALARRPFVEAARALGASPGRILLRHVGPAALPPLLVAASQEVGRVLLYESALSFLGLGVRPPAPSWGLMLRDAALQLGEAPALALAPGLATLLAVLAVHAIGDGLREALDPRLRAPAPGVGGR
jgi:peptide/nickel transport system permease protein